jgi:hypothetical protein
VTSGEFVAHYRTTIESSLSIDQASAYMADFANAVEWDPGVVASERLFDGPVALGSRFLLQAAFGKSVVAMEYVLAAYEPGKRLLLVAETDRVKSIDEITFATTATGCAVTYDADLETLGRFRWATPLVAVMFRKIGDRARDGLKRVLNP